MGIEIHNEAGCCHIRIEDELTIYTASAVAAAVSTALNSHASIGIDLSGVTEIDTAGLQILLVARKEALLHERQVRFIGQNRVVLEALQLMNLINFFTFEAAAAQAA